MLPNAAATDHGPFDPPEDRVDNPQHTWRDTSRWSNMFGHWVSCCGLWLLPPFDDPRIWHGTQHTNIAANTIVSYLADVEAALPVMGFFKLVSLAQAPLVAPTPTLRVRDESPEGEKNPISSSRAPIPHGRVSTRI